MHVCDPTVGHGSTSVRSLVPRPSRTCKEGLVTHIQILGPTSEFESVQWDRIEAFIRIMQLAKEFMTFYVLPCESTPSRYYGLVCVVCFQDLLQQLEVRLIYTYCTSSRCRAVYFWKQNSQSCCSTSNIIEGLVGVQLCTLFVLQICLTDGTANTT